MNKTTFIKDVMKLDFKSYVENNLQTDSSIVFYFVLSDNTISFFNLGNREKYYLDRNGKFKSYIEKNFLKPRQDLSFDKCLLIHSRPKMLELESAINDALQKIEEKYAAKGERVYPKYYLNIEIEKINNPKRLFNIRELETVLKKGDDSKDNTLVIDENAKFALVQKGAMQYPVRFEMFCSGNGYVGKNIPQEEIKEYFGMALSGWLHYLEDGEAVYVDYRMDSMSDEEKIKRIKKIIKSI